PRFLAYVARAALALSNHRDGGRIIIGAVRKAASRGYDISPLNDGQMAEWRDTDLVLGKLGPYGAPQVICEIEDVANELRCAIVRVQQFSATPVICAKNEKYDDDLRLRRGAMYCRPAGGPPRSVEPEDPQQASDVISLAIQIGINKWVEQTFPTGLI